MRKFKIAFVSSEIVPFAKTGGLADVSGALGKYLNELGHDIRLIMPLYDSVNLKKYTLYPVAFAQNCEIWFGPNKLVYSVFNGKMPGTDASVYFIHCPQLYNRGSLYTNAPDEHIRFALLSRAAIELCQRMNWSPDIFHCNDWQSAMLPVYLRTVYGWDKLFHATKTVLTIHNIGYQGKFPAHVINDLNLSDYFGWFDAGELYNGQLNFLRSGLMHANKLTTVSPTYADEIQSDYFGEGLQDLLRQRSGDLVGILNGVDYDEWNPETDTAIPKPYSLKNLAAKETNKKALLKQMGLSYSAKAPVLGMITRLAEQKGIDLLYGSLEAILDEHDVRLIVLGSGEEHYERHFYHTQVNYKDKVVFYRGYNYDLAHLIEAGSDMFVMPSRYEPCGLNQIYSLKYGTIPIVRRTGGLADTVQLYQWEKNEGTGFVFEHYTADSLLWAMRYAITTFAHRKSWKQIMRNAMKQDFSWDKQIAHYVELYSSLLD